MVNNDRGVILAVWYGSTILVSQLRKPSHVTPHSSFYMCRMWMVEAGTVLRVNDERRRLWRRSKR